MKLLFHTILACSVLLLGCQGRGTQPDRRESATSGAPCAQRYVLVGSDPEIALDTQLGVLCRTVANPDDPLGILDPECAVTERDKSFIPDTCKSGRTWVRGVDDKKHSRSSTLPFCAQNLYRYNGQTGKIEKEK